MKPKPAKLVPFYIASLVVGLAWFCLGLPRWVASIDLFERLEWMTYDWRTRQALGFFTPVSTNLGVIYVDDDSLNLVNQGLSFTWPWPRQLYGRLIGELNRHHAKAIGFDILFRESDPARPETDVLYSSGRTLGSDDYFALRLRESSNVVLIAFGETLGTQWRAIMPADPFRTNAFTVGHATSESDPDGVLRRARAFRDDPVYGRLWHMGIILAARDLGLDLGAAEVERSRVVLRGPNGLKRVIPLDKDGFFYINWALTWNDNRLTTTSFEKAAGLIKSPAGTNDAAPKFAGKLVFIGSIGSGNNISDIGATPLARETYLVSKHWNVANALITDQFIHRASVWVEALLILGMVAFSHMVSLRFRAPWPSLIVVLTATTYVGASVSLFVQQRYWLPIILPVLGGLVLTHVCLLIYQALFEQKEKRRIEQVFSKLVSPDVVRELLSAEKLDLGGKRKHITVFFSDVRGFTQMTDSNQEKARQYVQTHGLNAEAMEAYYDEQAALTLSTVNVYLATIADEVKHHQGTLDKYIGDCVMAFWGAPVENDRHALSSVRAAIAAQRAIYKLNQGRAAENKRREQENQERAQAGLPGLPLLPILTLGTGINTGHAIVGLMGSEDHILNYTVFGSDVNLASRLEALSGRARILIGESTFQELKRLDPDLAGACREQPPAMLKGFVTSVKSYEVPWKETETSKTLSLPAPDVSGDPTKSSSIGRASASG